MSRVAIVTGGASGIGRATAELLTSAGVQVAVVDRHGDVPVDVSDAASVARGVEDVRRTLGPVDILVNAAGIPAGGPLDGERYVEVWEQTLAVNLTGAMLMVRACLDDLARSGTGRIVNVASTEALSATPLTSPYSVSKHGLLGFTRSLAVDLDHSFRQQVANSAREHPVVSVEICRVGTQGGGDEFDARGLSAAATRLHATGPSAGPLREVSHRVRPPSPSGEALAEAWR